VLTCSFAIGRQYNVSSSRRQLLRARLLLTLLQSFRVGRLIEGERARVEALLATHGASITTTCPRLGRDRTAAKRLHLPLEAAALFLQLLELGLDVLRRARRRQRGGLVVDPRGAVVTHLLGHLARHLVCGLARGLACGRTRGGRCGGRRGGNGWQGRAASASALKMHSAPMMSSDLSSAQLAQLLVHLERRERGRDAMRAE